MTPSFDDDQSLASALFYMSFVTLTSTGYGDIVPLHRSLCNIETVIGQLYPATLLARLVYPRNERSKPITHSGSKLLFDPKSDRLGLLVRGFSDYFKIPH